MIRAYLENQAVWPGDDVVVHVQGDVSGTYEVVEFLHSDPHPEGPGLVTIAREWGRGTFSSESVRTAQGSYAESEGVLPIGSDFTLSMWVMPTNLDQAETLASWRSERGAIALQLSRSGLELQTPQARWPLSIPIRERVWYFVGLSAGVTGDVMFFAGQWGRTGGPLSSVVDDGALSIDGGLRIGTAMAPTGDLDGKVAGLRVHDSQLDLIDVLNVMNGVGKPPTREWSFEDRSDPDAVPECDGGPSLVLRGAPTWSGDQPAPIDSSSRPLSRSGSVHFHRDDVEDCGWSEACRFRVPSAEQCGIYVVRLNDGSSLQDVPFMVKGSSAVCLLIPTLTWQAYANLGRGADWPGLSHYALHSDGSPTVITTAKKPSQTFTPSARFEVDAADGFAGAGVLTHLLMADLYAWHWMRECWPSDVSVIDDRQLHASADVLEGVNVLILSAHPEYWTERMLDNLSEFLRRGGNVIYLGGNGLYWVVSLHPSKPYLMEVRRWGGSQTCSVDPADRSHQFEPRLGGTWAHSQRPPNALVGVGFAGFGNGPSLEYVRTSESHEPTWRWLFDGVDVERFGSTSLNTGAFNEFDAYDPRLGSPGVSTVLATALPTRPDHFGIYETDSPRAPDPEVRADLVATRTSSGGLVLAVSAISASGALSSRSDDGLKRILSNAVSRMLTGGDQES